MAVTARGPSPFHERANVERGTWNVERFGQEESSGGDAAPAFAPISSALAIIPLAL